VININDSLVKEVQEKILSDDFLAEIASPVGNSIDELRGCSGVAGALCERMRGQ
jgi:hypothetical protein